MAEFYVNLSLTLFSFWRFSFRIKILTVFHNKENDWKKQCKGLAPFCSWTVDKTEQPKAHSVYKIGHVLVLTYESKNNCGSKAILV